MPFSDAVLQTRIPGLFLIPASRELCTFERDFSSRKWSETLLSETLYEKTAGFDYLIFDPTPMGGLLMMSALTAAQEVIIPVPMRSRAMEGLAEMMRLIYTVNALHNPGLRLGAIIPTFLNGNNRLVDRIAGEIIKNFGADKLFPGVHADSCLAEAPGHCKSIFEYAPDSTGARDYLCLADRIDKSRTGRFTDAETMPGKLERRRNQA